MTRKTAHQPGAELVIRDLDTLKVTADPLRLQIMAALGPQPLPVKAVAAMLGIPAAKL